MLKAEIAELLQGLKAGSFRPAEVAWLDQTPAAQLLDELRAVYRFRFQERRLRHKWEFGLAKSLRHELLSFFGSGSLFPIQFLLPIFRRCLFVSGEGDRVTGLALTSRLVV